MTPDNRPNPSAAPSRAFGPPVQEPRVLLVVAIVCLGAMPVAAQDTVYVANSATIQGYSKITGRISEYTGKGLQLQTPGGQQRNIPAEQIVRVETYYTAKQTEADARFERAEFAAALNMYHTARTVETRRWVRLQITAQMVWCHRALGQLRSAGAEFLLLVRSDPDTIHFSCIPLAWASSWPSMPLEAEAGQWITTEAMPAAVLLGASHLMSTDARPQALARLKQLATHADPRIAQLAYAQTWRATDRPQIDTWRRAIDRMPEALRPGPYYVLGAVQLRQQQWEPAALSLMHVPILFAEHRHLAARSLLDAGLAMRKLDRPEQAARLYRELIGTYPNATEANEANERLAEMMNDE